MNKVPGIAFKYQDNVCEWMEQRVTFGTVRAEGVFVMAQETQSEMRNAESSTILV